MIREELFYEMIFKRKSFHLFRNHKTKEYYSDFYKITDDEIQDVYATFKTLRPLIEDIEVEIRIVENELTTCKRGQEYCILFYSEKKTNYLQNIGFIGEQLDLYLASKNIGALWFGIGKTEETTYNGLEFVTMIAICKVPEDKFRKDMFKSKRKPVEEIWCGTEFLDVANIVRFAPSSCNTQPWVVEEHDGELLVYRYKKPGKRGIMPVDKVVYQNLIDIGIFILFLSLCLEHKGVEYSVEVYDDDSGNEEEMTLACRVKIQAMIDLSEGKRAKPDLSEYDGVSVRRKDYVADETATYYAISFDPTGQAGWKESRIYDEDPGYDNAHIVEVL